MGGRKSSSAAAEPYLPKASQLSFHQSTPPSPSPSPQHRETKVVYALIIINKAGGLIYQRDFAEGLNKLTVNDYLVLAGTFHGIHAITTRLHPLSSSSSPSPSASAPDERPLPPSGIEVLETENFRLQCFQTLTGTKFLLFTEPQQPNTDRVLQEIYRLYGDYVMKNPFYQLEMPVRCEGWERRVVAFVRGINSR
ncbi:hypothetical protein LZ554_002968 [Drepanopeziza brunnea f. sp. 'monogermtubi']|nr:hypothetical protein LZ554_002968 [Drepanopeziza brunnea f. sp. 'monogermtubi']